MKKPAGKVDTYRLYKYIAPTVPIGTVNVCMGVKKLCVYGLNNKFRKKGKNKVGVNLNGYKRKIQMGLKFWRKMLVIFE